MNANTEDDLSYLDLLHQCNERMAKRAVELQKHRKQIIAETEDAKKRERAIRQLEFFKRMESRIPKTL
ncbi:MAG TPA: hypothetical protein VLN48_11320 [Bryobacteraceae bacterium]|nr:hypothetical protein [Bryobacteraceae bacterium]